MSDILIATQVFHPDIVAVSKIMTDISIGLAQYFDVEVLTQNRDYNDPSINFLDSEEYSGVKITRVNVPPLSKNKNFQRAILSYLFGRRVWSYLLKRDYAVLSSVSLPINMAHKVAKVATIKKRHFVYFLHDLYPDVIEKSDISSLAGEVLIRRLRTTTKEIFSMSSKIVVLGRDVKDYIKANYNVPEEKIEVITNWSTAEEKSIRTEDLSQHREKRGWIGKFIIVYSGNLGVTADFDVLLKAAVKLNNCDKDIKFVLVGRGRKRQYIENFAETNNLKNLELLDFVPNEEYQVLIASADVLFVSLNKNMFGISVPSKTYSYLSAGKPILGLLPENSEIACEIEEDKYGILCTDYHPDTLVDTILSLKNRQEALKNIGEQARRMHEEKYGKQQKMNEYVSLYKHILR